MAENSDERYMLEGGWQIDVDGQLVVGGELVAPRLTASVT